jgi:CRISPR-associated endonuclease/helicase Cas3
MDFPESEDIYRYWGKYATQDSCIWHLLPYHGLDVAAVGNELLRGDPQVFQKLVGAVPLRERYVHSLILFFLAVHDIGKFSGRFQGINAALQSHLQGSACHLPYNHHHTTMGMLVFVRDVWPLILDENWFGTDPDEDPFDLEDLFLPWIRAATGHHGKPVTGSGTLPDLFSPMDRQSACGFARACSDLFHPEAPKEPLRYSTDLHEAFTRISWLIAGLAVVSDWIGSDADLFRYHQDQMPLGEYWRRYAVPRAREAVARAGLLPSAAAPFPGIASLLPEHTVPTPLQKAVAGCELAEGPCLFIIEDVTGSGKTEAALALTHRLMEHGSGEGIFMALPTMATANGMYRRFEGKYRQFFMDGERPSLLLTHSARNTANVWRRSIGPNIDGITFSSGGEAGSAECAAWLSDNRKKALLADVGVGTIDQALMAVLPLHHQSLRLLGLARHVLVVDECRPTMGTCDYFLSGCCSSTPLLAAEQFLLSRRFRSDSGAVRRRLPLRLRMPAAPVQEPGFTLMTMVSHRGAEEMPVEASTTFRKAVAVELTAVKRCGGLSRACSSGGALACWYENPSSTRSKLTRASPHDGVTNMSSSFTPGSPSATARGLRRMY